MRSHQTQRGFLLIVAVILIAVAATMAAVIVTFTAGSGQSGGLHVSSTQALYAAESGLERALRGLTTEGTTCANLSYTGTLTIGGTSADFTTTGTVRAPSSTALSVNILATDSIIPVNALTGYASHGRVTIAAETIQYSGTSTDAAVCGAAPCLTGAVRGAAATPAVAHSAGDIVRQHAHCVIRSVGTSSGAQRTIERAVTISADTGAMIVYAKDNPPIERGIPFYRLWDEATLGWGAEQQANSIGGGRRIQYIVLKAARTRNEVILGTQDNSGDIMVQVWDGTSWGATTFIEDVGGYDDFRGFDIEYETNGDRALIVYQTTIDDEVAYRVWDGVSWSGSTTVALPAVNVPQWVELAANPEPNSNEIMMMVLGEFDDVYGMRWDGVAWDNMGVAGVWDACPAPADFKNIDVAYEQRSNPARAIFVWGRCFPTDDHRYRIWSGAAPISGLQTFTIGDMSDSSSWVRLAPDPFSNNMLFGVQDDARDLNTAFWDGSADTWTEHGQHDGDTEDQDSRNFDLAFDPNPVRAGEAWLVWGSRNGNDYTRHRQWIYTGTWGWGAITDNFNQDASVVQLRGHPNSGRLFAGIYEDNSGNSTADIDAFDYSGAWSGATTVWDGGTRSGQTMERVNIAPLRFGLGIYDWVEIFP